MTSCLVRQEQLRSDSPELSVHTVYTPNVSSCAKERRTVNDNRQRHQICCKTKKAMYSHLKSIPSPHPFFGPSVSLLSHRYLPYDEQVVKVLLCNRSAC